MLFKIIMIGKIKDVGISSRIREYRRRMSAYGKLEIVELADSNVENEGKCICRELEKERNSTVFVMSEEGQEYTSVDLAQKLGKIGNKITFVIGGPYGLSESVKNKSDVLLSLSKLTFTHEIAALLLFEQLYRCENIIHGGSYHH